MIKYLLRSLLILVIIYSCSSKDKTDKNTSGDTEPCNTDSLELTMRGNSNLGLLYKSNYGNLYQGRACNYNNSVLFHFLSMPKSGYVRFVELNSCKQEHIIDSVYFHTPSNKQELRTNFINRQYDNLITHDGYLYYYKEKGITVEYESHQMDNRDYYRYALGSNKEAIMIENKEELPFFIRSSFNSYEKVAYTNDSIKAAFTNGYDIRVSGVESPYLEQQKLLERERFQVLTVNVLNGQSLNRHLSVTDYCDIEPLYGSMCWDNNSQNLYFTKLRDANIGLWKYNIKTRHAKCLIQEEGLYHPFAFNIDSQRYIGYSRNDEILLTKIDEAVESKEIAQSTIDNKLLEYKVTDQDDGYWKRGVIYKSYDEDEKLFNPNCIVYNDTLRYFFFGAKDYSDSILVKLYEYTPDLNAEVIVIDSAYHSFDYEYNNDYLYMTDCILFVDDLLFYNINKSYSKSANYNRYSLTSHSFKGQATLSNLASLTNKRVPYLAVCPLNKTLVSRDWDGSDMAFFNYNGQDLNEAYERFSNKPYDAWNFLTTDANEMDYEALQAKEAELEYWEEYGLPYQFNLGSLMDINKELGSFQIGSMNWDYSGQNLFFCNSYIELACIWKVDIYQQQVDKIVPEHDAMHPFYFEYHKNPYVLYVENNKLMVCEPSN